MIESLKIIFYPDPRLRKISEPVTVFDQHLADLTAKMLELMRADQGVGLAAPQVGINQRIFVANATGKPEDDLIVVNPVLSDAADSENDEEGCLSLPKIRADVDRALTIRLNAQDIHGQPFERVATGFEARIWQHEFDHLNGVMIIDRMGFTQRMAARKRLRELEDDFAAAAKRKR